MKNWWRTDEELMKNWWRTDEKLMKNWWERMKGWWRTDEELMKNWWRTDEELLKTTTDYHRLPQTATDCHWLIGSTPLNTQSYLRGLDTTYIHNTYIPDSTNYKSTASGAKNCTVRRSLLKQVKYKIALLLHSLWIINELTSNWHWFIGIQHHNIWNIVCSIHQIILNRFRFGS